VKPCTRCGEVKLLSAFPLRKGLPDSWCKSCYAARSKEWYVDNREKRREREQTEAHKQLKAGSDRKYREVNKEKISIRKGQWYAENKELVRASARIRYAENPEPAKTRSLVWKENNKEKHNAECMKRHAAKLQRFPLWARECPDVKFFLEEVYALAIERTRATGVKHHVDHIIPLQGERVSGLHLPCNLQVITAAENCAKRNSYAGAV
jgi:hypothetical protein